MSLAERYALILKAFSPLISSRSAVSAITRAMARLSTHESAALERLIEIKQRSPSKGFILIAADFEQVEAFVSVPDGPIGEEIRAGWPVFARK